LGSVFGLRFAPPLPDPVVFNPCTPAATFPTPPVTVAPDATTAGTPTNEPTPVRLDAPLRLGACINNCSTDM
jgi:hypothetical protein